MSIPIFEQETVIQFSRDSEEARIWTSDTTMMTKLDNICAESSAYRVLSVGRMDGEIVNKEYVTDKALISLRKNRNKTRELSEEEKTALAERLRK
jgi:hypothetical protein